MNKRKKDEKPQPGKAEKTGRIPDPAATTGMEIAVIGMAGRFPGAPDYHCFWENLQSGRESICFFIDEELEQQGETREMLNNPHYVKARGTISGEKDFDALFFGYTPDEASAMDPQMRIFLETAWQALEDAGYDPYRYEGLIGLYAGSSSSKLNLKGPAAVVQTACSTSLAAVHQACRALLTGECDMAMAGGVSVQVRQKQGYLHQEGMVTSKDGHCRTFDARTTGLVDGSGAGIVVLKRLEKALEDSDYIYAVIKGSAVNNDGEGKMGYTAPSVEGQAEIIRTALRIARVEPESISYVETHGTGTSLGDQAEIAALELAFNTTKKGFCCLGAVKNNIGHLDAAAGIAGFIKTVLAIKHGLIPPIINFETPNPNFDFQDSPFYVNRELQQWHSSTYPLRAGVSSFGISGTYAHVVLEEWPGSHSPNARRMAHGVERKEHDAWSQGRGGVSPPGQSREYQLILLSAKTGSALDKMTQNLVEYFKDSLLHHGNHENPVNPGQTLADAAYTLQLGRKAFPYRRTLVCQNQEEAIACLSTPGSRRVKTFFTQNDNRNVIFMFPGLGAQYVNMGLELYQQEPLFRREMDRCFEILTEHTAENIKETLYPTSMSDNKSDRSYRSYNSKINQPEIASIVIFIFEYALARLLMQWGIKPFAMIGYSFGEYTAACISGVFSLEDALKLVAVRGQLIRGLAPGALISIPLSREQLAPFLNDELSLAIDNGPSCIVGGSPAAVDAIEKRMKQEKMICIRLPGTAAIHSHLMTPILNRFREKVGSIPRHQPQIPYISNVTGTWITDQDAQDPDYWSKHLRETVRFSRGLKELLKTPGSIFVEIGPGSDLSALWQHHTGQEPGHEALHLVRRPQNQVSDMAFLLNKLGRLWGFGGAVCWPGFYHEKKRRRIPLPTYPFERQSYWFQDHSFKIITDGLASRQEVFKSVPEESQSAGGPGNIYPGPDLGTDYIAPANEIEENIACIWQDLFGLESIGTRDDFFELGGDSLKAIMVISKIHKQMQVEIPIGEFFNHPSVRGLAAYINRTGTAAYSSIDPVEKKEYYPLSPVQRRLYLFQQIEPSAAGYNSTKTVRLEGKTDREKLENIFRQLIHRHEIYRTSIRLIHGVPVQRIHPAPEVEFTIDYQETGEDEAKERVKNFIKPFDLSKVPALRVGLIKTAELSHIMIIDMHHSVTDLAADGIFIKEMLALVKGEVLPPQPLQYKDYAQWQNSTDRQKTLKIQEKYWLNRFSGEIPVLDLPMDFPRPARQHFEGNTASFAIDSRQHQALKTLALKENVTMYMVFLSMLNVFLAKLSGQEDMIIGTPVIGRRKAELQNLTGMFVNTLALRNFPEAYKTYHQFLQEIRENTLASFENQDYPFEELIDQLEIKRDLARSLLFDVMIVFRTRDEQLGEILADETADFKLRPYDHTPLTSQYDLVMEILEQDDHFIINFQYCTKLFKPGTVTRFMAYFKNIVSCIIKEPAIRLEQIDMMPETEKKQVLYEFNRANYETDSQKVKTIHQLCIEQVEKTPDNIAVVGPPPGKYRTYMTYRTYITHKELHEQSNQLAYRLRSKGVGPDTIVGIMVKPSLEMEIGLLAILKAGGAYLPLDPDYPQDRIAYMLTDSSAKILLRDNDLTPEAFNNRPEGTPSHLHLSPAPVTSLAYGIYTSGSTGKPKGVLVSHGNLFNTIQGFLKRLPDITSLDYILLSNYVFDATFKQLFFPLMGGVRLHIVPRETIMNSDALFDYCHKTDIQVINAPISFFKMITGNLSHHRELPGIKYLLTGGEKFYSDTLPEFYKFFPKARVINSYGPTETAICATFYECSPTDHDKDIPIGTPINHTWIYILDRQLKVVPLLVTGEIFIGGKGLARGYLNNPELTADRFYRSHLSYRSYISYLSYFYRSGDLARWQSDGNIQFIGRIDLQVKIRGYRIELGEIEDRLRTHEHIKDAIVLARKNAAGDQDLCAYIVPRAGQLPANVGLREHLLRDLPDYMVPAYFILLEKIPLTPNGKIDRKALPKPISAPRSHYAAPRDEIEKRLVNIWSEVLTADSNPTPQSIGIDDNFFELGGHSLKAVTLLSRIHQALDVQISMAVLFKTPNIRELSRYIKEAKKEKYISLEPTEKKDYYVLSSAQKRFYILQQMEPQSTAYHMTEIINLPKEPVIRTLETAFLKLIHRHESLRTSFFLVDEAPVQRIYTAPDLLFTVDYFEIPASQEEQAAADFVKPFDLTRAPLLRAALVKASTGHWLLILDMHHIISDGVSLGIMKKEFFKLYQGQELDAVRIQYKDFSEWQNSKKQEDLLKAQESYWLQVFPGQVPVLNLPTDYPRPAVRSFVGNQVEFSLDPEETLVIKNLARENNITLYMALLAVFNLFFSKLSSQEDIIIGTPIAARRHVDLQKITGMMANTLTMRNYPSANKTLKAFLAEVKERTLQAFENQEYQFEELVDKLALERDTSRNPLFDVMFNLMNQWEFTDDIEKIKAASRLNSKGPFEHKKAFGRFDVVFITLDLGKTIFFILEYSTRLFTEQTIERFIRYLKTLILALPGNENRDLANIEFTPPEEKQEILRMSTGIEESYPAAGGKTIPRLFAEQAAGTPDHIALKSPAPHNHFITYKELNQKTNRLARLLKTKGIGPDKTVGLLKERSLEMIMAMLAILKAGGAYLPLDPQYPAERIMAMLADSQTGLLLTEQKSAAEFTVPRLQNLHLHQVPSIATPRRAQIKDLDRHPYPNRTLVNYEKYHRYIGVAMAKHTVTLQTSRGCPYNCAYCHKIWPKTYITRNAENILREIRQCYDAGIRRFVFVDDIFNLDKKHSGKVFELLIKHVPGIQLFFPNGLRGDILTRDFIDLMVEAGMVNTALALEAGSPRIQKLIGKHLHLEKFRDNIRYISEKYPQVLLEMEMMIGFPSETEAEALMTMDFLKSIHWVHFPNLHTLKIFPNTDMYRLAVNNGVSKESIEASVNLAYHELPETLPFSKEFTRQFQAAFTAEYFLLKERLLQVLPQQMKILTADEMVQKYDSYLPIEIRDINDILDYAGISREELGEAQPRQEDYCAAPDFVSKMHRYFPRQQPSKNALKILFLDLSLFFSAQSKNMLYNVIEEPLGLMYLMSYLDDTYKERIQGKIAKSWVDFDNFDELKKLVMDFKPDLIGIRTLSFYKNFFHQAVLLMRQWGVKAPIIAGGPYATSDYQFLLQDFNIDLAVLGEGEITLGQLVEYMLENNKKLPPENLLETIPGIAFVKNKDKEKARQAGTVREILLPDQVFASGVLNQYKSENLESSPHPGDMVYVIYTSGSTGKPKGVMLEHANLNNLLQYQYKYTNIDFRRVLQFTTMSFDVSFQEIFSTLLAGGQLVLVSRETISDIPALFKLVEKEKLNTLFLPASFLKFIMNEPDHLRLLPGTLSHLVTAGEQLIVNDNSRKYLQKNHVYLHNHYGPSETHVVTALTLDPTALIPDLPSIGKPISNTGIYILDKGRNILPARIPGELCIAGLQVGRGYLNNPELTAEKFDHDLWDLWDYQDGYYRSYKSYTSYIIYKTGDLARWLPDGNIEFLGRIDQQVKIRGFRVETGEIESILSNYPGIKTAVVSVGTTGTNDQYLCAYIVSPREFDKSHLREYLGKSLPDYMVPSFFVFLDAIPLTPSGKIDRKALPQPQLKPGSQYTPPQTPVEKKLAEIWSQVLGIEKEKVSINHNFFEWGGHSLRATILISRIHKVFNVKVPLVEIFKTPHIRGLAGYITGTAAARDPHTPVVPVEKKEYYKLSSAQERLFIIQQMSPDSTGYHLPSMLILEGKVDKHQIENAFKSLIRRHESFRSSFTMAAGETVQKIQDKVEFEIEFYNLATEDTEDTERKNYKLQITNKKETKGHHSFFVRPFDLSRAPLLRVGLFELSHPPSALRGHSHLSQQEKVGKYILMLDMHHIITDGTSHGILMDDFTALYRGEKLTELRIQYKDYSQWQERLVKSEAMKLQGTYWLSRFSGEIPVLNLPVDYVRPMVQDFSGNAVSFNIGKKESQYLKALARQEEATLFMVLLAVFNVFLAKVSGQEDIVVGTPTANRKHNDLQQIIGMFVNTLPLRNYPIGRKTFRQFLTGIKKTALQAFENQNYPFENLVEQVVKERDAGRNPLFDVMFTLQNLESSAVQIPGLKMEPYPSKTNTSKFDITFVGIETGEEIYFGVEYCTKLFKQETIERLIKYFRQVIVSIQRDHETRIREIEIIPPEERNRMLLDFNNTRIDHPADRRIHEHFAQQVEQTPNNIAVVGPPQVKHRSYMSYTTYITYKELNQESNRLAYLLREKGAGPDTIVSIMMERSIEMIVSIMGILKAGSAYLPIDPEYPEERLNYMLKDSGARVLLKKSEIRNPKFETNSNAPNSNYQNKRAEVTVLNFEDLNFKFVSSFEFRASNFVSSSLAYIMYTSGTTGRPKGTLATHYNVFRVVKNTNYIEITRQDRVLQLSNYAFDGSVFDIYGALLNGASLVMTPEEDVLSAHRLSGLIKKQAITLFFITTALFNTLIDIKIDCFAGIRKVLFGGEKISIEHAAKALAYLGKDKILHVYGPTETTVYATYYPINYIEENPLTIPIGQPIANTAVYILDKHLTPVPLMIYGEIYIGGDGVARGYLNNPELTAERFSRFYRSYMSYRTYISKNLYKTGDLGRWLPDGNIQFLGRIDHQVKIRGFRVEPGEIVSHLLTHRCIKEAVVVDRAGRDGTKYLCAYWVPDKSIAETNELTVSKLREFLSGKLAPYMLPAYFVRLENIPLTPTGKTNRKLLPEPDLSQIKLDSIYEAPVDDLETLIADTWKEVLKLDRIGTRDNFFDLGGNSLKILRVSNRLTEALGSKIPVVDLFRYPTISALKKYLQQEGEVTPQHPQEEIKKQDIAVIGMAGKFPGAANISQFWENLKNGVESISFFSDRELEEQGVSPTLIQDENYVKAMGTIRDKYRFDAAFFNYTPPEARVMDPQMRMFHECAWAVLEDAGYNPEDYDRPIGLYAGAPYNLEWGMLLHSSDPDEVINPFEINQLKDSHFIPTRVSYKLDLKGPAMFIHTACSTSLVAIHTASNALLSGDCDMALAGGVNLASVTKKGYLYQEGMIVSPDGHCRAFDIKARGLIGGEGAAIVLLKPLASALRDGDHIYALVKASAVNNDGIRRVGFSAPGVEGQAEAIRKVYGKAGVPLESITYIETHGTGTILGDPIEIEALKQAFNTDKKSFCAIGSVKTNVGHMDSAAGAVGFIKVVLALTHRQIPPTLHFEVPNQQIDLVDSPFYVNTALSDWQPGTYPMRAGVSSFGLGGTNAHAVLEEWRDSIEVSPLPAPRQNRLMILSAKTASALEQLKIDLAEYFQQNPGIDLADAAYTLQIGRKAWKYRWMALCATTAQAAAALGSPGQATATAGPVQEELQQIGLAWLQGNKIEWNRLYLKEKLRRVSLPTYPFEGDSYGFQARPTSREGLLPGKSPGARKTEIADWFYFPRWTHSPGMQPRQTQEHSLCVLVFINGCPLVSQLVKRLRATSSPTGPVHQVITVADGGTFKKIGNHEFVINPHSSDHYCQMFTQLHRMGVFPNRILHAWNLADKNSHSLSEPGIVGPGFYSLLYTARAIGKQDFSGEICIDVLSDNIQEVTGDEALVPGKTAVLGPIKVIPQEYPYILCRSIDIQLPPAGSPQEQSLVGCLINEFLSEHDSTGVDIAYRGRYRWIKTYEPMRLEPSVREPLILRKQGVYLVTGGGGNVGFVLAEYLVKQAQARLVLTGSTPLPTRQKWEQWLRTHDAHDYISRKISKILQLEAQGGKVLYMAADAADKKTMAGVVRKAEKTFGPINGVIHAAGTTKGNSLICPIEAVGEKECLQQFHPKIQGTLVLSRLFKHKPLDFCLLTSSLSPILGGLGFAAYSAANAFMDSFAHLANRSGSGHWLSVNWADWHFDSKAASPSHPKRGNDTYSQLVASAQEFTITPRQGAETFARILTLIPSQNSQVVVSAGDLQTRIDQWVKLNPLRKDNRELTGAQPDKLYSGQFQARPELSSEYAAPRTPVEQAIANTWKKQLGFEKIGIRDDFFELGGDSLKAITMISRIHKDLDARIQLKEFFDRPTIESLAQYITAAQPKKYVSITPVEKREYYAASSAQKRLYILEQMRSLSTSYNMIMISRLEGELDKEYLESVFKALIKRHESFRTSFEIVEGNPVQRIHDEVEFEIEYFQVEVKVEEKEVPFGQVSDAFGEEEGESAAEIISSFKRPFDFARAPLMRVGLIKTGEKTHILLLDMHHVITDGISQDIMKKEFIALYSGKVLPPLRLQYKDFAWWQNTAVQREWIEKQGAWWLKQLAGDIPVLDLPLDYPRPQARSFEGDSVNSELSKEDTIQLNEIARTHGATLFMVLLAAFNVFLAKITGQEDILVGTPTAGRRHNDLDHIIGMFINTLVMRNYPASYQTFPHFLREVKEQTLEAFENQEYPLEDLVEKRVKQRDTSRNPLFDVLFVLQSQARGNALEPGHEENRLVNLKITPRAPVKNTSAFDLVFDAAELHGKLVFSINYWSKILDKETIHRFIRYFKKVIAAVKENPGIKLLEIDIIPPEEKKRILYDFNDTAAEFPAEKTIHQLVEEQVEKTPDNTAVVGPLPLKDRTYRTYMTYITYKELNENANQLAGVLGQKGITADSIAAIMVDPSLEMFIGLLAILKAGGAYLPLDPAYPSERIKFMLEDSGARILLKKSEIRNPKSETNPNAPNANDQNKRAGAAVLNFEDLNFEFVSDFEFRASNFVSSSLAYIIYTSGSTGRPKGVLVTHRNLYNTTRGYLERIPHLTSLDYILLSNYIFDATFKQLFFPLMGGACVHFVSRETTANSDVLFDYCHKNKIQVMNAPISFLKMIINNLSAHKQLPGLQYILTGAEKLTGDILGEFFRCFPNADVINSYGPTETTMTSAIYQCSRDDLGKDIPIGTPINNTYIYILDVNLRIVPLMVPGEIFIGGKGLTRGYLNNPELTAEKFVKYRSYRTYIKLYKTGDLARWLSDGNIQFIGRIDQQVKIRGFRIELEEIASRLLSHEAIKDAIVVIKENETADRFLCAYIVPHAPQSAGIAGLREYLAQTLPDYMIPSYFVYLERLPLTPGGKVDRQALPEPGIRIEEEYVAPKNKIEKKLRQIWSQVLQVKAGLVGINHNFFQLGGHSLKATIMASQIHRHLHIRVPLIEIFKAPTIKQLAEYLGVAATETPILPAKDKNLVLLGKSQNKAGHFFFIHDGSGEVEGYIEFCHLIDNGFNWWGVRADDLENFTPRNRTIEELAHTYIETIKRVQPEGPYFIGGWSLGGTIAFEMVRQLEQRKEKISFLALIDSPSPDQCSMQQVPKFTLESEKSFIKKYFSNREIEEKIENINQIDQLWPLLVDYLESQQFDPGIIKKVIVEYEAYIVPGYSGLGIGQLIKYLNRGRTFHHARALYAPTGKIDSTVHYLAARQSKKISKDHWNRHCRKGMVHTQVPGDHYSIFKKPYVVEFAEIFDHLLKGKP